MSEEDILEWTNQVYGVSQGLVARFKQGLIRIDNNSPYAVVMCKEIGENLFLRLETFLPSVKPKGIILLCGKIEREGFVIHRAAMCRIHPSRTVGSLLLSDSLGSDFLTPVFASSNGLMRIVKVSKEQI